MSKVQFSYYKIDNSIKEIFLRGVDKNKFSLIALLAKELKVKENEILSYDLSLHSREKGCLLGANDEFVSVGRLDNLAAFHASLNSLIDNKDIEILELMNYIKGPDFPTGAIIDGRAGIIEAYKTGRGKIKVRGK